MKNHFKVSNKYKNNIIMFQPRSLDHRLVSLNQEVSSFHQYKHR
jgi:hypothetical protein